MAIYGIFLLSLIIISQLYITSAQLTPSNTILDNNSPSSDISLVPAPAPAPAPAPSSNICNGIWLSYRWRSGKKLHPLKVLPKQPYSFKSDLTILNNDYVELKSWQVYVGFQNEELVVSATNVLITNGSTLPALVGEGTVFSGFPVEDLKTGIQTAGDLEQMKVKIEFEGTQFGVAPPDVPLPHNISLVNDGYICPEPFQVGMFLIPPLSLSLFLFF